MNPGQPDPASVPRSLVRLPAPALNAKGLRVPGIAEADQHVTVIDAVLLATFEQEGGVLSIISDLRVAHPGAEVSSESDVGVQAGTSGLVCPDWKRW